MVMKHFVHIIEKKWLTHDVLLLKLSRPVDFTFQAGQAIEVALEEPRFFGDSAPFTLTGLNSDNSLEIILKVYFSRRGITHGISELKPGDKLIISAPWDSFPNLGPGVFIAGGAGITSFLALLRHFANDEMMGKSKLFFSNKTEKDIFFADELEHLLGTDFIRIVTRENNSSRWYGRLNKYFLQEYITRFDCPFYISGPGNFTEQIKNLLVEMGIKKQFADLSIISA